MKNKGKCRFEGCDNDIQHKELNICYTCYSGLRYWRDRNVAEKRARQQQIIRLGDRMDYMLTGEPMPKAATKKEKEKGK